jgi:Potassium-transporting ATPase A subunit
MFAGQAKECQPMLDVFCWSSGSGSSRRQSLTRSPATGSEREHAAMTLSGWLQIALYFVVLTALVVPLGRFMARVFEGERTFLSPVFRPVETVLYRAAGEAPKP